MKAHKMIHLSIQINDKISENSFISSKKRRNHKFFHLYHFISETKLFMTFVPGCYKKKLS